MYLRIKTILKLNTFYQPYFLPTTPLTTAPRQMDWKRDPMCRDDEWLTKLPNNKKTRGGKVQEQLAV